MAPQYEKGYVIPDERTPRTYGMLNIVFASLLLLCNLGTMALLAISPTIQRMVEQSQTSLKAQLESSHQSRLDRLKLAVANAKTKDETATAKAKLAEFEALPKPQMPSMTMGFAANNDRRITSFSVIDLIISLILNLAMLIAGVGLLRLKESGRKLSVVVAGTKLVTLALYMIITFAFILPLQTKLMEPQMAQVREQLKGARPNAAASMMISPQGMAAMQSGGLVLYAIVAAIYPILTLLMLTRPRVKAACWVAKPSGMEPLS